MKILVTGGCGYIGSHTCVELLNNGYEIELKDLVLSTREKVEAKMNDLRVADAIDLIFDIFRRSNKYIDETMPWVLAKDDSKLLYKEYVSGINEYPIVRCIIDEIKNKNIKLN